MRRSPDHSGLPEAVRAMLDPATYPESPDRVELLQTHISWIFRAGRLAYKMKKPVKLDFLDFSTLRRRLHYCHREVKLNRRLAPDVYREVVPLRRAADGWHLGGSHGRAREYLVVMRRMDDQRSLHQMIEDGEATAQDLVRVGKRLALFHRDARRSPSISRYGRPERFRRSLLENFHETLPFVGTTVDAERFDSLRRDTLALLSARSREIRRRVAEGRVVEGHGDLHARHVYLDAGRVTVLDGIEFNFRFLCLDTACDLAFLTMDLKSLGRPDLATVLLNAYLDHCGDYRMPLVLPLYESYRAFVRGKVGSMMASVPGVPARKAKALAAEAAGYFALAATCLRPAGEPRVVLMAGVSGSGKSSVARILAQRTGAVHLRSDVLRKITCGIAPETVTPRRSRAKVYSPATSERVYGELAKAAGVLHRAEVPVVVDATFLTREGRARFIEAAGIPPASVLLTAFRPDHALMAARLAGAQRDETLSDADADVLRGQLARWEPAAGHPGPRVTIPPGTTSAAAARRILDRLRGGGGEG